MTVSIVKSSKPQHGGLFRASIVEDSQLQQQLALLKSISAQKPESHQYKINQLVPAPAEVVRLEVDVIGAAVAGRGEHSVGKTEDRSG